VSLTVPFSIGTAEQTTGLVPIVLVVSLVITIALFRALQTAAFRSVQLAPTLAQIRERGREVIDDVHPAPFEMDGGDSAQSVRLSAEIDDSGYDVLWHGDSEVLQVIDIPGLVGVAETAGVAIELPLAPGETVADGSVLAVVRGGGGGADDSLDEQILKTLTLGLERTFEQDPRFALRILADIALRALSPAVNDPTTAAQVLDSLDSLLRTLMSRDLGPGRATDPNGVIRVAYSLPDWGAYVGLALDELVGSVTSSPQVRARLERLLVDLIALAPPARREALESRLLRLRGPESGRSLSDLTTQALPAQP
jgi:uncharacterized membrane protein